MTRVDIHALHCCTRHGCKYGKIFGPCPVESGEAAQLHPCKWCDEAARERALWVEILEAQGYRVIPPA